MYAAKARPRGAAPPTPPSRTSTAPSGWRSSGELRSAIEHEELRWLYQPKVDARERAASRAWRRSSRWPSPDAAGSCSPRRVHAAAPSSTGLIRPLTGLRARGQPFGEVATVERARARHLTDRPSTSRRATWLDQTLARPRAHGSSRSTAGRSEPSDRRDHRAQPDGRPERCAIEVRRAAATWGADVGRRLRDRSLVAGLPRAVAGHELKIDRVRAAAGQRHRRRRHRPGHRVGSRTSWVCGWSPKGSRPPRHSGSSTTRTANAVQGYFLSRPVPSEALEEVLDADLRATLGART